MMFHMMTFINKKLKIFNSIITSNTIFMMNNFCRFKIPANMLFHYKTMFRNISRTIAKRMIGLQNGNIPRLFSSPIFIHRIFVSRNIWMILSHFKFRFFRNLSTFKQFSKMFFMLFIPMFPIIPVILSRKLNTFFPFIPRPTRRRFTILKWHLITSKIKAVFRSLTEMRLNISTLLTANFRQNNTAFPLDINNIAQLGGLSR